MLWMALSWVLYAASLWPLGLLASIMFFLCALRLNHEATHGNLRLSRRRDSLVKHMLSAVMLGSNRADAYCRLKHHKHSLGPYDCEGKRAHMTARQVLAYGPRFSIDLNLIAWRSGSRY